MGTVENRMEAMGFALPPPKIPVANYLGCKQFGDLLFVSGRVSELRGEVGSEVTKEDAQAAACSTVIHLLSIVKVGIDDLDLIASIDKLQGFVRSAPSFTEQPFVIDGASDFLISVSGDNGRHARTETGVAQLPFGAAVQLEMILRLHGE
jgi:enamine deaminase RidA (YjgF/YER057c/UK114 family)